MNENIKDLKEIEWLLEQTNPELKKTTKYNPDYDDVTKFNSEGIIINNVDRKTLEALSDDIMDLLDTSFAIYEKTGDYAFGRFDSSWCQLMDNSAFKLCDTSDTKKALNSGKWLCHENCWNDSAKEAMRTGKSTDIECIGGIHLYAEPIKANNEIIGCANIGYGNPPQDEKTLTELAEKYNIDKKEIIKRSKEYKPRPPFIIENAKKRLKTVAMLIGQIVENNQHKLKYHKINDELQQTIENLETAKQKAEENEAALQAAMDNSQAGIAIAEVPSGKLKFVNKAGLMIRDKDYDEIVKDIDINEYVSSWQILHLDKTPYKPEDVPLARAVIHGDIVKEEFIVRRDNNEDRYVLAHAAPINDSNGKRIAAIVIFLDITESKKAQLKIQENEKFFKDIIESMLDGFSLLDEKGIHTDVNSAFCKMIGYSKKELIGTKPPHPYWPEEEYNNIQKAFEKTITGNFEDFELIFKTKEGKRFPVLVSPSQVKNKKGDVIGNFATIKDISERKKYEERLRNVIDSTPFPIAIVDTNDENVYYWSKTAIEMFGHDPKTVKEWYELAYPDPDYRADVTERWKPFLEEASKSKTAVNTGEYQISCKDGTVKTCELYANFIPGYLIVTLNDITHKKESEIILKEVNEELASQNEEYENLNEELQQTIEELQFAKEKAEESDRLKSAFLANMSHEIRTPMNGILGFTDLLQKPNLSGEKQHKYIDVIQKSGKRMLSTINDIVEISKIEAGDVEPTFNKLNINNKLNEYYTFFKPQTKEKGIILKYITSLPDEESIIHMDEMMFDSILTNLIKNAIKYTDDGEIEFGYKLNKNQELQFYIKDTGIGIPEDRKEAVFNRFTQADIGDTRAAQGSGLGLSITKAYVEILGGEIWLESNKNKGSVFYFTIPFKTSKEESSNDTNAENLKKTTRQMKNLKILIVEDDKTSDMHLSIHLEEIAKEIIHVTEGTEAIEACSKNPDIDLVLMDIKLPKMNGYEATRKIREFNKEVIIIAQTAYAMKGDREIALKAGCNDYITKPIAEDLLMNLINKWLGKQTK